MSASTFDSAVNLSKMCIGCGIFALPYSTLGGGLLMSLLINFAIAVFNGVSSTLMLRCKRAHALDIISPKGITSTYSRIAYAGCGWAGVYIADFSLIVTLVGVCVTYQITFAQLLSEIPGVDVSLPLLTIISAVIIYPLSCAKDIGYLASVSLAGIFCLLVGILTILSFGWIMYSDDLFSYNANSSDVVLPLWPASLSGLTTYIGVATFCYALTLLVYPVEESMKNKDEVGWAIIGCLLFCWLTYALIGDVAGILYAFDPTGIQSNIMLNLPQTSGVATAVKVAMAGVCLLSPPLTLVIPAQMIETALMIHYPNLAEFDETAHLAEYSQLTTVNVENRPTSYTASMKWRSIGKETLEVDYAEGSEKRNSDSGRLPSEVPTAVRYLNRFALIVIATIFAIFVPCFGLVLSLLGSCTVSTLTYVMPPLLHLLIVSGPLSRGDLTDVDNYFAGDAIKPTNQYLIDLFLTVFGVLLTITCTSVTAYGAYQQLSNGQC